MNINLLGGTPARNRVPRIPRQIVVLPQWVLSPATKIRTHVPAFTTDCTVELLACAAPADGASEIAGTGKSNRKVAAEDSGAASTANMLNASTFSVAKAAHFPSVA